MGKKSEHRTQQLTQNAATHLTIIIIIIIKRYTRHNTSKHAVWSEASFTQPTNRQTKQIQQQRAQQDSVHHSSQFIETWSTTLHPPNFPNWNLDLLTWHSQTIEPQVLSSTFNTSPHSFTTNLHLINLPSSDIYKPGRDAKFTFQPRHIHSFGIYCQE